MATRVLYLIRHGHHDLENSHQDDLGGGLTSIGVEQAKLAAQRFSKLPITAIHSSTKRRAAETADIIAGALPDVPRHRSRGLWECIPSIPPKFAKLLANYSADEDLARAKRQVDKAFSRYFKRARGTDKHEIIVAHGNLIRYLVCRVLRASPEAWINMDLCNCGVSKVLIRSDGWMTLVSHNDVAHLPQHLITSLTGSRLTKILYGLA